MKVDSVVEIIINIIFVATFIGIFFFTYAAYIEKKVVKSQVDYAVSELLGDIQYFGGAPIKDAISQIKTPNLSKADAAAKASNKKLIIKVVLILSAFFIVGMSVAFFIAHKYDVGFTKAIIKNLIILIAIGLTEFSFLTFFGAQYKSLDPNFVKKTILQAVQTSVQ